MGAPVKFTVGGGAARKHLYLLQSLICDPYSLSVEMKTLCTLYDEESECASGKKCSVDAGKPTCPSDQPSGESFFYKACACIPIISLTFSYLIFLFYGVK